MATFSENQVRHLYVINSAADFSVGGNLADGFYFNMKDANGKPVRSDIITNVIAKGSTNATKMRRNLRASTIAMNSTVNSGNPIVGEDYTIRIEYSNFIAQSDEVFYHEFGSAHAISGMTAADLLIALAENLTTNTKKQEMVDVLLAYSNYTATVDTYKNAPAFSTSVTYAEGDLVKYTDGKTYVFTAAHSAGAWDADDVDEFVPAGIAIVEKPQAWILGRNQDSPVIFTTSLGTVSNNGDDVMWGTVDTAMTGTFGYVGNGRVIADMEYFYHGNRGDIYRMMSFPNVIDTKYMVDPTKEYDAIDIHYAYVGANHSVQKSEKTITLVADSANSHAIFNTASTGVIAKINAVAGAGFIPAIS